MAIEASKTKRFLYKQAEFLNTVSDEITLEKLLNQAFEQKKKVGQRYFVFDSKTRFINAILRHETREHGRILGIEFLSFEKGADISILKNSEEEESVDVSGRLPDPGQEFVEGSIYLGVNLNDLVITQSASLRTNHLESYLNMFLVKSGVIEEGQSIYISDKPKEADVNNVRMENVSEMELFSKLNSGAQWDAKKTEEALAPIRNNADSSEERVSKAFSVIRDRWNLLHSFLDTFCPGRFNDLPSGSNLSEEDILDASQLEMGITLKWKNRRKDKPDDLLTRASRILRHVDDDDPLDYKIKGKDKVFTKKDVKTEMTTSIEWRNGRPVIPDIYDKMARWLCEIHDERGD